MDIKLLLSLQLFLDTLKRLLFPVVSSVRDYNMKFGNSITVANPSEALFARNLFAQFGLCLFSGHSTTHNG